MIEACSVNVLDLRILRRTQSGKGGDGSDATIYKDLRAHHEESAGSARSRGSSNVVITDELMIDGFDADGDAVNILPKDLAQWTDHQGVLTDKLEIVRVTPFSEPGRGIGMAGLAHVRLQVG